MPFNQGVNEGVNVEDMGIFYKINGFFFLEDDMAGNIRRAVPDAELAPHAALGDMVRVRHALQHRPPRVLARGSLRTSTRPLRSITRAKMQG